MSSFDLYGLGFVCKVCGCDDHHCCEGGCDWADANLCTRCAPKVRRALVVAGCLIAVSAGAASGFLYWLLELAHRAGAIHAG